MNFELFPIGFYVSCLLIAGGLAYAATGLREGWGIPAVVVLLTVGAWYVGDALYNDYEEMFWEFGVDTLSFAWWQVAWFVTVFLALVRPVHLWMNRGYVDRESFAMKMYEEKLDDEELVQHRIDQAFKALAFVWLILTTIALIRTEGDFAGLFAPYLAAYKTNPWGRAQIGGGFSAVLSLAGSVQMFLAATFGVIWAVSKNPQTRWLAGIICLLSMPFYLFDRTRNAMLAVVLPGALAWSLLRLKTSWLLRTTVLAVMFLTVNSWMLFVMAHRTDTSIAKAWQSEDAFEATEGITHEGLNMFSELGWINHFMKQGALEPSWGYRYFAEAANIIPRGLWPDKPTIGLDYSVLRGQTPDAETGMVTATIATGLIGQGVVNFGTILGPVAAALLIVLWVSLVGRQDLMAEQHPTRFLLFATGIILTFNMGRDITLLVAYPFFFGYIIVYYFERRRGEWRSEESVGSGGLRDQGTDGGRRNNVTGNGSRVASEREEMRGGGGGASVLQKTGVPVPNGEIQKTGQGPETRDERRDVGTGGTVRTLPTRAPKRIARWMPRRVRQQVAAEQRAAADQGTKGLKDEGTNTANGDVKGEELRVAGKGERTRQLAVPFQNYRRYRG